MNSTGSGSKERGIRLSSVESEVLLSELFCKLKTFPDSEKAKVLTSWLSNSFADLNNDNDNNTPKTRLLNGFIVHVKLFNTLANNSSFEKACQLAELFSKDFLNPFVLPALTEPGGNISEATYYFQYACENITQPLLIRKIMQLVIDQLMSTLLSRLNSADNEVMIATLGLFKVLLEFYCEDLWYELILQYLIPMKHLMVSERQKSLPEISYSDSTIKFLDIIPGAISEALNPEVLAEHFVLYIQQELNRLKDIDSALKRSVPLSKSQVTRIPLHNETDSGDSLNSLNSDSENHVELTFKEERNPIFPHWVFKYDGTDVLHASRKYSLVEPEEYFEDDLFHPELFGNQSCPDIVTESSVAQVEEINNDSSSSSLESLDLDDEIVTSTQNNNAPVIASVLEFEDARNQARTPEEVTHSAYLGPFLDSLYKIIGEWTRVEPELVVMASEILSVLASSRIPLISTLVLDLSIILQPYYPSFSAIVHTIRGKLDGCMQKYPPWFIKKMWQKSSSSVAPLLQSGDDDNQQGGSLRDKILKSNPFSLVSKFTRGNSFAKLFSDATSFNENRLLNRTASGFETEEQEIVARKMTLRCILFTHWLLELAAISQQICWFQSKKMLWT